MSNIVSVECELKVIVSAKHKIHELMSTILLRIIDYMLVVKRFLKQLFRGLKPTLSGLSLWGLVIVVLFSAGLCVYLAATQPHSGHEIVPGTQRGEIGLVDDGRFHAESNGLLYYQLENYLIAQDITSNFALRSISVASGLGAIIVIYLCGNMLRGPRTGLICAWLLAINSTHLTLTVHNRFFAFNELFCALATLLFIFACQKGRWLWWVAYALSICICISSMVMSAAILVCHAIILILLPQRKRALLPFLIVGLLGVSTFVWLNVRDSMATQRFTYGDIISIGWYIECWLHNNYSITFQSSMLEQVVLKFQQYPLTLNMAFALLLIAATVFCVRHWSERNVRVLAGLLFGWFFLSICLLGYSCGYKNILNNSNLSWLIPGFILIIGWAASRYRLLLYFLAVALLLNPLDICGTYAFPCNNEITDGFFASHVRSDDIVMIDSTHPLEYLESPLLPLINKHGVMSPGANSMVFTPYNKDKATQQLYIDIKTRLSSQLQEIDVADRLQSGRIWILYAPQNKRGPDEPNPVELFVPDLADPQKYVIVHNVPRSDWESKVILLAPFKP